MVFDGFSYVNANDGIFNEVAGSQFNVYNSINIYLSSPVARSHRPSHPRKPRDDLSQPTSDPKVSSAKSLVTIRHSSFAFVIDATLRDIANITEVLINRGVPLDSHLVPELKFLQKILILNKLAIEAYGDRPFGKSLAGRITPAVVQCCVVLQELLDKVCRTGLNSISIRGMPWSNGWDKEELLELKTRLRYVRNPLGEMLRALDSVSWVELGKECSSTHVPLAKFHTFLKEHLPSLEHIQLNSVQVVDHLGRIVPVPTLFCSSWKEFSYVIKGHCRNLPGSHFIEQGDYEVMRTADSQIIGHSEFTVKTGMVLEIAIIMRQQTTELNNMCPRCDHPNPNVAARDGWIECVGCPALFQVGTVDKNHEKNDERYNAEGAGEVGKEDVDEGNKEGGEKDDKDGGEGWDKENSMRNVQELISPATQQRRGATNHDSHPWNDDDKRYFRRMLVLNSFHEAFQLPKSEWYSLSEPTANELTPYRDLTGQVTKTEEHYFAYGSFSEGFKGEWANPATGNVRKVAIKFLRGVHTDEQVLKTITRRLNRETRVWHRLSHANILPFLGVCRDLGPSNAMISPLCSNGPVLQYLARNPEANRLNIIVGVAQGLRYLHSREVIHGDLKGHNVLISDNGIPLLADYGRSKLIDYREFATLFSGSAKYLTPELVSDEPDIDDSYIAYQAIESPIPSLSKETDVFAFSMVALEIFTGKFPFFYLRQNSTVIDRVLESYRPDRSRYLPTTFTDPMWTLFSDCWNADPRERPDMTNVVQRLEAF